ALLGVTPANANMILRRLEHGGLLTHVSRGRWLSTQEIHRFALPELISAPYPACVSLQSALFHHGLIEQVPAVIYAVTLARPRRVRTPLGVVSFHRVPPELFSGFEVEDASGAKIATAEKALFDVLYLAPGRSRLFAKLPELEIPRRFHWALMRQYVELVKSPSRRTFLTHSIARLRKST
ncbi:MAG: type IV toxin-antitoxin system AbiEi family antitoxin domain-containing protein, partial [Steroidobacteraceae bacterium]